MRHVGFVVTTLVVSVMATACGSNNSSGQTTDCGPNGECPAGQVCQTSTNVCVEGENTVDAMPFGLPDAPIPVDAVPTPPDAAAPDAAPPDVTITTQPPSIGNHATVSFEFTSTASDATFECSLNQAAYATCVSPLTLTLADGSYTFDVHAVEDGVDSAPAEAHFTIDTTPPDTMITGGPTGSIIDTSATFTFISTEASSTFLCRLDDGSTSGCTSPKAYTALALGSHTFVVFAVDPAGNADLSPATATWQVVETMPVAFIDTHPDATTPDTSASFTFHSDTATATFECSLDNATYAACLSPLELSGLAAGAHSFNVRAVTVAGTRGLPASFAWTIDETSVTATITGGADEGGSCTSVTFTYSAPDSSDMFACSLDGAAFAPCPASGITYTGLVGGPHTFAVHATDSRGNTGPDATRAFTVDTIPPTVSISSPAAASTTGGTVKLTFATAAGSTIACTLDGNPLAACASGNNLTGLQTGMHTVAVSATDSCQNTGSTSVTWSVDATPPTVSISSPENGSTQPAGGTIDYTVGDSKTVACTFDNASVTCGVSGSYFYSAGDGQHTFTITGTDAAGNASAPAGVTFIVDLDPPIVEDLEIQCESLNGRPAVPVATFDLSDASGVSEIDCLVDGSGESCGSGDGGSLVLPCGTLTFEVYGTDEWGNSGASDSPGSAPGTNVTEMVPRCGCELT